MGRKRKGENKICIACEKSFYVPAYRINSAKFCSLECQNHKQYDKFKFTCASCKKESTSSPSRRGKKRFCSNECANYFQIDRKKCQKELRKLRIEEARKKGIVGNSGVAIRKLAFSQKDNKCQICGYGEHKSCLDVHHIDNDPNNNKIENLAILCVMCHRKVHRKIITLLEKGR